MSYCRRSNKSDVYMYHCIYGRIECCMCQVYRDLGLDFSPHFLTRADALTHLVAHKVLRHKVPKYVIDRLWKEIEELGNLADSFTANEILTQNEEDE